MTPKELAAELGIDPKALRAWLRREWPRERPGTAWELTTEQVAAARLRWANGSAKPHPRRPRQVGLRRRDRDEDYVLDLLDEILGQPSRRQHTFAWLLGDRERDGRKALLRVDGFWSDRRLVAEYRERQHDGAVTFLDKPYRATLSGIHREERRRIYDERRDALIPAHGLTLLIIRPVDLSADGRGRLTHRYPERDRRVLLAMLEAAGIDPAAGRGA